MQFPSVRRAAAVAALIISSSACSGNAVAPSSLPSAGNEALAAAVPSHHHRRPNTTADITATASFVPSTIKVGERSTLTIFLKNNTAATIGIVKFYDPFPAKGNGQMSIAAGPTPINTCGGTINGAGGPQPGDTSIQSAGGSIPANGECKIVLSVTVSATGIYEDTGATFAGNPSATFSWPRAIELRGVPTGDHLYVPTRASTPGQGSIQVYAAGIANPTCTITSSAFPNPENVATDAFDGDVFVADQAQTVSVFHANVCKNGGAVNVTPQTTFALPGPAEGMAVDSKGQLAITVAGAHPALFWYDATGTLKHLTKMYGEWTDVTADIADDRIYVADISDYGIWEFDDSGAAPVDACSVNAWADASFATNSYDFALEDYHIVYGNGTLWFGHANQKAMPLQAHAELMADEVNCTASQEDDINWSLPSPVTTVDALAYDAQTNTIAMSTEPAFNNPPHPHTPQVDTWPDAPAASGPPPVGTFSASMGIGPNYTDNYSIAYGW